MFTPLFRATGLVSLLAIVVGGPAVSADRPSPKGIWIDDSGRGAVEIKNCEGDLCGRVVWLKSAKNADRCNLQILGKLTPTSDGKWGGGWIYDPEAGEKYDVEITPIGDTKLRVLGYAGAKMFGRTMTWTKAPDSLKRCDEEPKAVETAQVVQPKSPTPAPPTNANRPTAGASEAPLSSAATEPPTAGAEPKKMSKTLAAAPAAADAKGAAPLSNKQRESKPTTHSEKATQRRTETTKLASLGAYGLQDVTLRKSKGSCSLKVSDFGNVSFPC